MLYGSSKAKKLIHSFPNPLQIKMSFSSRLIANCLFFHNFKQAIYGILSLQIVIKFSINGSSFRNQSLLGLPNYFYFYDFFSLFRSHFYHQLLFFNSFSFHLVLYFLLRFTHGMQCSYTKPHKFSLSNQLFQIQKHSALKFDGTRGENFFYPTTILKM